MSLRKIIKLSVKYSFNSPYRKHKLGTNYRDVISMHPSIDFLRTRYFYRILSSWHEMYGETTSMVETYKGKHLCK